MVTLLAAIGLLIIVGTHTAVAAVLTRVFRVQLSTRWGPVLYSLFLIPVVLTISTLIVSGVFGLGPDLGGGVAVLFVMVLAPLAIGITIDYIWMPTPEEIDLPDTVGREDSG